MLPTAVELTRDLVRVNTVTGNKKAAADVVAARMEAAGFEASQFPFPPGRTNLVAAWRGDGSGLPLPFTGHLGTGPVGESEWNRDPHGGEMAYGFMHGRAAAI